MKWKVSRAVTLLQSRNTVVDILTVPCNITVPAILTMCVPSTPCKHTFLYRLFLNSYTWYSLMNFPHIFLCRESTMQTPFLSKSCLYLRSQVPDLQIYIWCELFVCSLSHLIPSTSSCHFCFSLVNLFSPTTLEYGKIVLFQSVQITKSFSVYQTAAIKYARAEVKPLFTKYSNQ